MIFYYFIFGITTAFLSWIVGRILYTLLLKTGQLDRFSNLNFIKSRALNKNIGILYFKWIVEHTFFKIFNQKIKPKNKTSLSEVRSEMITAEVGHLIAFIFMSFVALYKGILDGYVFGLILMLVNILMNLYPSLLQQENKRRIDRLIKRH